ncbi:MAG: hypothetical protein PHD81_02125 [Candidatus Nanoarchaeia archaeon]|nr:hypothetical protein [Candidatus Nanoarchaeia archaeon]MDD5587887.1 hypothetical protein [Candidatus Nanoarchaeia archaeon]
MASSPLAGAIEFFQSFGLFDILLPFLLVFTIVFAILEKTMILGAEDKKPKKNLDSMVSFVIALLVIASNKVVTAMTKALPNIILLVIVSISFLLMIGVFATTDEFDLKKKHKTFYYIFTVGMFVGVIIIFMASISSQSVYCTSGQECSWLEISYNYVMNHWGGSAVSSIVLLAVIIGAILYVTGFKTNKKEEK